MRAIGNLIWFIFGGLFMGLAWCIFGLLAFVSIVGIPWGRSCFVIAGFSFFPFGKEAIARNELYQTEDIGTGYLGLIGNIIWFIFAGFWLALGHLMSAVACFITIIGTPFALQHLKLAVISIAPIGQTVIARPVANAIRHTNTKNKNT